MFNRISRHGSPIESLESRLLLAGNVSAEIRDDVLHIVGDRRPNSIIIEPAFEPGQFRVVAGDENTTINREFQFEFSANLQRIRIRLGGGDDSLILRDVDLPGDLDIRSGKHDDAILIQSAGIGGDLRIKTQSGRDTLNLLDVAVSGETRADTGSGHDIFTADGSEFSGRFTLRTRSGRDSIFLGSSIFSSRRRIDPGSGKDLFTRSALTFDYDFRNGPQGWSAGFADFFTGREEEHELDSGIRPLPQEIGEGTGFFISGNNFTDDLFMYLTRRLSTSDGLSPDQTYQVRFQILFASNAPSGCGGIGGAPGESVYLKAGASPKAPATVTVDDLQRLNLDHGEQAMGGSDVSTIGHIANGLECEPDGPYVSLERKHIHTHTVEASSQGRMHIVVGTDSGFEGTTSLHYQRIVVQLIPIATG